MCSQAATIRPCVDRKPIIGHLHLSTRTHTHYTTFVKYRKTHLQNHASIYATCAASKPPTNRPPPTTAFPQLASMQNEMRLWSWRWHVAMILPERDLVCVEQHLSASYTFNFTQSNPPPDTQTDTNTHRYKQFVACIWCCVVRSLFFELCVASRLFGQRIPNMFTF